MTPETRNAPVAVIAATTWILIQYELSAGTSGPGAAYRTVPARPRYRMFGAITNAPSERTASVLRCLPVIAARMRGCVSRKRYVVTATRVTMHENSYMFPHGTRCTATPRVVTAE